jgi:DNA-binding transcriptional LysR family regulator
MHISRTDLNLFVVFDAIYTEGSITRAAETLNLTQPAVSHALGRLRELLNDELFTRGRGQGAVTMVPTPIAHQLVGPVRASLKALGDAVQGTREFDPATASRRFRINLGDIFEALVLPGLMENLQRVAPRVEIINTRHARDDIPAELAGGRLDIAVDVLHRVDDSLRMQRLARDQHVCLVAAQHPLAQKTLTLEDYLSAGHILASSRTRGPGFVDVELARRGLTRRIALRCQHYLPAALVASRTALLLTVPRALAQMLARLAPLEEKPLPLTLNPLEAYVYWHASRENDPANRWLRNLLTAAD